MRWNNVLGALLLFAALAFLYAALATAVLVRVFKLQEASFAWTAGTTIALVVLVASG